MKSTEDKVLYRSEYFLYSPSKIALKTFLYPIGVGHFYYEEGYRLNRTSYDSYLLVFVLSGSLQIKQKDFSGTALAGDIAFLDCFIPHEYTATEACETLWIHFDGISARPYFDYITTRLSRVFSVRNPNVMINKLERILSLFESGTSIQEARVSKYINDILTELALNTQPVSRTDESGTLIEETISYLSQHSSEDITIEELAGMAGLSKYYFIRLFKKETGFTPHDYLINMRINAAKYLLSNTSMTVKEVCFFAGFSNESVFSSTFKKKIGQSPSGYRSSEK